MARSRRAASRDSKSPRPVPGEPARSQPAWRWRGAIVAAVIAFLVLVAVGYRLRQWSTDPDLAFLPSEPGAKWIRAAVKHSLLTQRVMDTRTGFLTDFVTKRRLTNPRVTVRAFRRFTLVLDGKVIFESAGDPRTWKEPFEIAIPGDLPPGKHRISAIVFNHGAHPCLWLHSDELGVQTDGQWQSSIDARTLGPVFTVDDVVPAEVTTVYPTVRDALPSTVPWLAASFVAALLAWIYGARIAERLSWSEADLARVTSWGLMAAWVVLGANNIARISPDFGYDHDAHLEYVRFLVTNGTLPAPSDGWQMFQPPLFYLVSAPLYALFSGAGDATLIKVLRIVPLLCGLVEIELVYRIARVVFPSQADLRWIATVIGASIPMQISMCQLIGNEPLVGCLTSGVILMSAHLLMDPQRPRSPWFFAAWGALWGFALLAKVTPLLLTPLLAAVIAYQAARQPRPWLRGAIQGATLAAATFAVAGWYFARNWLLYGKPFVLGHDLAQGNAWWQEPSFRTWQQLTSFGVSLRRPIWSATWSLWDSLYATMWLDGFLGGRVELPKNLAWNANWLAIGAWLGLLPTVLILLGLVTLWSPSLRASRSALLFAAASIALYLAAVVDLYVRLPFYGAGKASYMLGLVPCFAVLAAAGAEPWLRHRGPRAILFSAITVWAVAAWAGYVVVR